MLMSVATIIVLLLLVCTIFLGRLSSARTERKGRNEPQERLPAARQVRRAAGQRVARRRMQANANYQADDEDNDSGNEANDESTDKPDSTDLKIGAKKRAKLAAKAEKKLQREAAEREREERKKRDQVLQEQRDKQFEKERVEELKKEEEENKAREEKERKEHEEYLRMKEAFSVEGEGFEEEDVEEEGNLLQDFIDYIKEQKVVILEDLSAKFGLRTPQVIERIQELQASGSLTGVIDDRGKFIYISEQELEAVAKFIKQRGRVSISDLAESSNQLINLNPSSRKEAVEAR